MQPLRAVVLILSALVLTASPLCGQRHARGDYDFGMYLLGGGHMRDARTFALQPLDTGGYTPAALDSLHYLRGWVLYNLRDFDLAAQSFSRVGSNATLYPKSTFFGAISHVEQGEYRRAGEVLDSFALSPVANDYAELLAFERAGLALLDGDVAGYDHQREKFTYSDFALAEHQHTFDRIAHEGPRNRSPWVAALASAVVPGLGKIYAGNVGEGVASFLLVGAMAGLTAESWVKAGGPDNWRTILYGTMGGLLYVGNIFGSAASVKIYYQEFETNRKGAVVYGLHIPLRSLFR